MMKTMIITTTTIMMMMMIATTTTIMMMIEMIIMMSIMIIVIIMVNYTDSHHLRLFTILSVCCKQSHTHTPTWQSPRHNCVQITWNTFGIYHMMQHGVCCMVHMDIPAINFDRVHITFMFSLTSLAKTINQ